MTSKNKWWKTTLSLSVNEGPLEQEVEDIPTTPRKRWGIRDGGRYIFDLDMAGLHMLGTLLDRSHSGLTGV